MSGSSCNVQYYDPFFHRWYVKREYQPWDDVAAFYAMLEECDVYRHVTPYEVTA